MMKLLLYGLLIYFLYKIIFEIVVPVSKGVKTVRQNMEQMQKAVKEAEAAKNSHYQQKSTTESRQERKNEPCSDSEYIDFEEISSKK